MRLVSFEDAGRRSWGGVVGDSAVATIADLGAILGDRYPSLRSLLAADALDEAAGALDRDPTGVALSAVTLLPPVFDPARILCAGVNYDEHRLETGRDPSAAPTIFTRYPSSLVGHEVPLTKPR